MRRGTSRGEGPRYYETGSQYQEEDHSGAGMCRLVGGLCFFVRVFFFAICAVRCGAVLPLLRPPAHLCARTTTSTTLLLPLFVCLPGFHNNIRICYIILHHLRKLLKWICSSEPPPAERKALEVLSYQTCGSRAGR